MYEEFVLSAVIIWEAERDNTKNMGFGVLGSFLGLDITIPTIL